MAAHWIRVELDETGGPNGGPKLSVRHFAAAPFHNAVNDTDNDAVAWRDIDPGPVTAQLEALLKSVIDANRKNLDRLAGEAAATHLLVQARIKETADRAAAKTAQSST